MRLTLEIPMNLHNRLIVSLIIILAGLSSLATAQTTGGTLTVAVQAEPDGLNLILTPATASYQLVMYNIVEPLMRYTADRKLVPLLATSYEVNEVDSGAEYTFHLRSGVVFHNGQPFTAKDVKYTFDTLLDPDTASPNASPFAYIKEVVVVDTTTVKFITEGKAASLVGYLASGKGTGIIPWGSEKPGVPYLDKAIFKIIPAQAASLAALRSGDVDFVDRMVAENAIQIENDPRFKIVSGPQNLAQLLAMNHARPPFDNVLVRRAIYYAIDRDEIITATDLKPEWGSPIGSHMTPMNPYYVDLTGMYPHDPGKARELLAQAGYPNGFDTTIYLPLPYQLHVRTGEIIADQLREVGINCKLEIVEWGIWLDKVYEQWDYDMTVIGHDQGLEPAANFAKGFTRANDDGTSAYYWQYTNYFLRELLDRGNETFNVNERKMIYAMAQTLIADDAVLIWIQDPHQLEGMRAGVMGYRILPMYVFDLAPIYLE